MEAEDLLLDAGIGASIDAANVDDASIGAGVNTNRRKKDRLSAIIVSGKSKAFLGHLYSTADIEVMKQEDLDALYMR